MYDCQDWPNSSAVSVSQSTKTRSRSTSVNVISGKTNGGSMSGVNVSGTPWKRPENRLV